MATSHDADRTGRMEKYCGKFTCVAALFFSPCVMLCPCDSRQVDPKTRTRATLLEHAGPLIVAGATAHLVVTAAYPLKSFAMTPEFLFFRLS